MKEQNLQSLNIYNEFEFINQELFYSNLFLVDGLVKKFNYTNLDHDDLRQAGLMGLFQAAKNYKNDSKTKFSTYASFYIIGEIKKEIRNNRLIKLNYKINKIKSLLNQGYSKDDIISITNYSIELINEALLSSDRVESLDNVLYEKFNDEYDNDNWKYNKYLLLKDKLEQLNKNTKLKKVVSVLYYSYFDKMNQTEIGNKLNLSQSQISRLKRLGDKLLKE